MTIHAALSLSELNLHIAQSLKSSLSPRYWVRAEISDITIHSRGHCYLELIDKPEELLTITAKQRATIWANTFQLIGAYFESETGMQLQSGLKVMLQVSVEFHSLYGMSLNVHDIEPSYTIGEEELQRKRIIAQLHAEGIFYDNKSLTLSLFPQKIAIISSEQAAGYQDFLNHLTDNAYNLAFSVELFHVSMQGVHVEQSIIQALDAIFAKESCFDAVIIIRGGGAKTDLRWFDNYTIASHIAQFPLPIITGIGHDKDLTITDMIAHTSLKTPTAVADFLIQKGADIITRLQEYSHALHICIADYIATQKLYIEQQARSIHAVRTDIVNKELYTISLLSLALQHKLSERLKDAFYNLNMYKIDIQHYSFINVHNSHHRLNAVLERIPIYTRHAIKHAQSELQLQLTKVNLHNPNTILAKGYSITTLHDGSIIRSASNVATGEIIHTQLADGTIQSRVE